MNIFHIQTEYFRTRNTLGEYTFIYINLGDANQDK